MKKNKCKTERAFMKCKCKKCEIEREDMIRTMLESCIRKRINDKIKEGLKEW